MDIYINLVQPALALVLDWLQISFTFAGVSIPIWAVFAFALLVGIFIRLLEFIGGIHFGDK